MSLDDDLETRWCDWCGKQLTTPYELSSPGIDMCEQCEADQDAKRTRN